MPHLLGRHHSRVRGIKQRSSSCSEFSEIAGCLQELCASRVAVLALKNHKVPTMGQMITMLKKHNMFEVLYGWLLAKIASKLEVLPGSDFCVGYEEAIKYGGRVILGDRPVQITMRRTWSKMPLQHKTKLLFSCLFGICGFLVSVDNTTCHNCTLIKVDSVNKPEILLEVVQILTDLDFIITKAYISSNRGWFMDGMFVSELNFYLKCINNYADVPCSCLLLA